MRIPTKLEGDTQGIEQESSPNPVGQPRELYSNPRQILKGILEDCIGIP